MLRSITSMRTSSTPSPPPSGWGLQGPQPRRAFSTALSNDHCHYFQVDILNLTVVVFFITVILPQQLNHLFISLDPSFFLYWGVISSQSLNNRNIKLQYLGYEYILCHPIAQLITFIKYKIFKTFYPYPDFWIMAWLSDGLSDKKFSDVGCIPIHPDWSSI